MVCVYVGNSKVLLLDEISGMACLYVVHNNNDFFAKMILYCNYNVLRRNCHSADRLLDTRQCARTAVQYLLNAGPSSARTGKAGEGTASTRVRVPRVLSIRAASF